MPYAHGNDGHLPTKRSRNNIVCCRGATSTRREYCEAAGYIKPCQCKGDMWRCRLHYDGRNSNASLFWHVISTFRVEATTCCRTPSRRLYCQGEISAERAVTTTAPLSMSHTNIQEEQQAWTKEMTFLNETRTTGGLDHPSADHGRRTVYTTCFKTNVFSESNVCLRVVTFQIRVDQQRILDSSK